MYKYYIKINTLWRMKGVSSSVRHRRLPARPICTHIIWKIRF